LLLRGQAALRQGELDRAAALLDSVEKPDSRWWLLRGQVYLKQQLWQQARDCLEKAHSADPGETAPLLEQCCRELGDYKAAYEYACMQK
jgi:tetratricopeptide (TPR) repeat protein